MNPSATTKTNTSAPVAPVPDNSSDCERVNTVLDQLIEGHSVTAEEEDYLYHHGTDCSPCFDDIKKQHIFIGFLNQRVSRRPIPARLPEAILARVNAEMA
jgi:sigma54-dependent transcription regulator